MHVLVELFDLSRLENVAAAMIYKPQKVIFIGFAEMMTEKRRRDILRFFRIKKISAEAEFKTVGRYDFRSVIQCLEEIADENDDCFFDVTGGRELPLVAMGVVAAERRIPLFQLDIKGCRTVPLKNCEGLSEYGSPKMTVDECIVLSGGAVVRSRRFSDADKALTADMNRIWEICRRSSTAWNRQTKQLAAFCQSETDSLLVRINPFKPEAAELLAEDGLVAQLRRESLILDYRSGNNEISFRFKAAHIHGIIAKSGNILELYTYMTAKRMKSKEDRAVFCDAASSVYIDWDGIVHEPSDSVKDTVNEIDVMLMRGIRPVFISCKGGEVKKEALYELAAVSDKFGGRYASKLLVCTHIGGSAQGRKYLLQRAGDMHIRVIEGVDKMTRDEFEAALERNTR